MRRPTLSHRNVLTHLTAAVVAPGCIALGWWQVTRALSGNTLSWAYVFEWPVFAGYAVFMWWKLIHELPAGDRSEAHDLSEGGVAGAGEPRIDLGADPGADRDEDEALASYNRYLAALNASGRRKHW